METLCVKNLQIYAQNPIVKGIDFTVERGQRLAIVGESGCGKTMTAMAIFGLLPEGCRAKGEILLEGQDLLKAKQIARGKELVLIPQSGIEFLDPVFRIRHQMYETLKIEGVPRKEREQTAIALLSQAGLVEAQEVLDKYPFEISGGMAQKVILALGMAAHPKLVIADEPTRGVDSEGVQLFVHRLKTAFADAALVIITHNMEVAKQCDNLLVMFDGQVMEYGPTAQVLKTTRHPYTKSLLHNLPTCPDFLNLKAAYHNCRQPSANGCPYEARCLHAKPECLTRRPPLKLTDGVYRRCLNA